MVGRQPRRVWKRESVKWWKITKGKQCSTVKYIIRNEKKIVLKRNQVFWYEVRRLSSRNVAHIYSRGRLKGPMLVECSQQTKPRTICCGCSNTSTIHKKKRKTKTMHSNTRRVILSFNNFLLLLFLQHQQNLLCIEICWLFWLSFRNIQNLVPIIKYNVLLPLMMLVFTSDIRVAFTKF